MAAETGGGFLTNTRLEAKDARFLGLLAEVLSRIPPDITPVKTVSAVRLRTSGELDGLAGLTHWVYEDRGDQTEAGSVLTPGGRQTITFYTSLMDHLSDPAYQGVIAHELAHAWLNEHVRPEESANRESEADALARRWGFADELAALESETEPL